MLIAMMRSPSIDIERLLRKLSHNNGALVESTASECLDCFLCGLGFTIFDIDLANAGVSADPSRPRNLNFENVAVFTTFFDDGFFDVCENSN